MNSTAPTAKSLIGVPLYLEPIDFEEEEKINSKLNYKTWKRHIFLNGKKDEPLNSVRLAPTMAANITKKKLFWFHICTDFNCLSLQSILFAKIEFIESGIMNRGAQKKSWWNLASCRKDTRYKNNNSSHIFCKRCAASIQKWHQEGD